MNNAELCADIELFVAAGPAHCVICALGLPCHMHLHCARVCTRCDPSLKPNAQSLFTVCQCRCAASFHLSFICDVCVCVCLMYVRMLFVATITPSSDKWMIPSITGIGIRDAGDDSCEASFRIERGFDGTCI